ncbi:hypothetical protein ACHAWF_001553 [Thalassiosira exigua]
MTIMMLVRSVPRGRGSRQTFVTASARAAVEAVKLPSFSLNCSGNHKSHRAATVATFGRDRNDSLCAFKHCTQQRRFGGRHNNQIDRKRENREAGVRLSTLLSRHLGLSRRQSERMILTERVTLFGKVVASPTFELRPSSDPNQNSSTPMKVDGKLVQGVDHTLKFMYKEQQEHDNISMPGKSAGIVGKKGATSSNEYPNARVWLANKLKGELITEDDPVGRPSMLQRLIRGGVGKSSKKNRNNTPVHLKPVGRLDMMTEGLMVFTNDGQYARELELPGNQLWRTYRVRVHGRLTVGKMRAMRRGLTVRVDNNMMGDVDRNPSGEVVQTGKLVHYKGVKVSIERKKLSSRQRGDSGKGGTNTWLRITCTEGKNRQLRRILNALGLDATRLIRISYGDYDLNTIPPGMAVEVPCKGLKMKNKGPLFASRSKKHEGEEGEEERNTSTVQWVNYS